MQRYGWHRWIVAGVWLAGAAGARADFIKPIDARVSSIYSWDQKPQNIINGSGLSVESAAGTHDNHASAATMWHAGANEGGLGGPTGNPPAVNGQTVILKLGTIQSYNLSALYVWNMNQNGYTVRGVKNVTIYVSSEEDMVKATSWTSLGAFVFNQAGGTAAQPAQTVPISASNVRLVKFVIQSCYGNPSDFVGLSEVRFEGTAGAQYDTEGVLPMPGLTGWANPYSISYAPWYVFDSAPTEYACASQGAGTSTPATPSYSTAQNNGTWLQFDFGVPVTMDRVVLATRPYTTEYVGASHFIFSSDATFSAADALVTIATTGNNGHSQVHAFGQKITARYVRWEAGSSTPANGNLGAREIRFLNTPATTVKAAGVTVSAAAARHSAPYDQSHFVNGDAGAGGDYIEYASNSQGVNTYADFDFGCVRAVAAFDYFDRADPGQVSAYDMIFSRDATWGNADDVTRSYTKGGRWTQSDVFAAIDARYVRFDVTAINNGSYTAVGGAEMLFYTGVRTQGHLSNPRITASADPFSASYVAANVFEPAYNSEFATSGNGAGTPFSTDVNNGTWIHFDFEAPVTVDTFINATRANPNDVIGVSRLIFSQDATFDAADAIVAFNPSGSNASGLIQRFAAQTARYVRWEVLSSLGSSQNLGGQQFWFLDAPALDRLPAPSAFNGSAAFPGYALADAADGNVGTGVGNEYASNGAGAGTFIDFDFSQAEPIAGFTWWNRQMDVITQYQMVFANNPLFTAPVATLSFTANANGARANTELFTRVIARYVRFQATAYANFPNTGMAEIEFYEHPQIGTMFVVR